MARSRQPSAAPPFDRAFASTWGGSHPSDRQAFADKLYLKRVPLDRDGYTKRGEYFGVGAPLFHVFEDGSDVDFHIRAADRAAAKRKIQTGYPKAKFGR